MEGDSLIDHSNLEEYSDAADYDLKDTNGVGVAFYSALAEETGGPVLEIACGTGRVAIPVARKGFAVTGLDIVPGMLEQARRKSVALPTRWVEGDGRTFDLGEQFRLIYLTGNAFQAFLTNADQQALLGRVQVHLHDEGLFAFETRNPLFTEPHSKEGQFVKLESREEEDECPPYVDGNGREVRVSKTRVYDHVAQILHWTTYRRWKVGAVEQTKVTRIALRYTFPQELAALLYYNGFNIERQYGDWNLEPLDAASRSIIVVCRKGTQGRDQGVVWRSRPSV